MTDRICEHCGEAMPLLARAHARYCSGRCRTAACRARRQAVPSELTGQARWVRRSAAKVPLATDGEAASSTDPATWTTYRQARASDVGVGLGCVLTDADDVVCIDLDHALDEHGRPVPWAAEILDRTPPTWIEVSPSGRGLHIWGRAAMVGGRRLPRPGGGVEVYGSGRYITVTGRAYPGSVARLGDLGDLVASLV